MTVKTIKITRSHLKQIIKEELEADMDEAEELIRRLNARAGLDQERGAVQGRRQEFWKSVRPHLPRIEIDAEGGKSLHIPPKTVEVAGAVLWALASDPYIQADFSEKVARALYRRLLPGQPLPARATSWKAIKIAAEKIWSAAVKIAPKIAQVASHTGIDLFSGAAARGATGAAVRTGTRVATRKGAEVVLKRGAMAGAKRVGATALRYLAAGPLSPFIGAADVFLLYHEFLSKAAKMYEQQREAAFFNLWKAHANGTEDAPGRGVRGRNALEYFDLSDAGPWRVQEVEQSMINLRDIECTLEWLLSAESKMWLLDEKGNYWLGGRGHAAEKETTDFWHEVMGSMRATRSVAKYFGIAGYGKDAGKASKWHGGELGLAMRENYLDLKKRLNQVRRNKQGLLNMTKDNRTKKKMEVISAEDCAAYRQ
jgi:hypothetical protein